MEKNRCAWADTDPLLQKYHDEEWGRPVHDDRKHYMYLLMEAMSCGLSWLLMLKKQEVFQRCFADFDYNKVAIFTDDDACRRPPHPLYVCRYGECRQSRWHPRLLGFILPLNVPRGDDGTTALRCTSLAAPSEPRYTIYHRLPDECPRREDLSYRHPHVWQEAINA